MEATASLHQSGSNESAACSCASSDDHVIWFRDHLADVPGTASTGTNSARPLPSMPKTLKTCGGTGRSFVTNRRTCRVPLYRCLETKPVRNATVLCGSGCRSEKGFSGAGSPGVWSLTSLKAYGTQGIHTIIRAPVPVARSATLAGRRVAFTRRRRLDPPASGPPAGPPRGINNDKLQHMPETHLMKCVFLEKYYCISPKGEKKGA